MKIMRPKKYFEEDVTRGRIDHLIEQLYVKLQNYKTIKLNPYEEIDQSIKKYFT